MLHLITASAQVTATRLRFLLPTQQYRCLIRKSTEKRLYHECWKINTFSLGKQREQTMNSNLKFVFKQVHVLTYIWQLCITWKVLM